MEVVISILLFSRSSWCTKHIILIRQRGEYDDIARILALSNTVLYAIYILEAIPRCSAMPSESNAPQRPVDVAMTYSVTSFRRLPVFVMVPSESAVFRYRSNCIACVDDAGKRLP